jgi:NADH dehydrogenase
VTSFGDLIRHMLSVIRRRRLIVNIPFPVAAVMGTAFDAVNRFSGGLIPAQITADQVRSLRRDNVASDDARGFDALGIKPTAVEAVLPDYLWQFRPSGQYHAIKESAANLRSR